MDESNSGLIENIERSQLMVAVRTDTAEEAYKAAAACAEGGVRFIEITFSVPGAESVIKELGIDKRINVGAGTVLTLDDARKSLKAGATYLVSPNCNEEIIRFAKDEGLVSIPGACTPTEIYRAYKAGGDIIKIFPFLQIGGLSFLKELRGPLPFIRYMLAGGVNLENIGDYVAARAACILVGSSIIRREFVKAGNWNAISELAARLVSKIEELRGK
ncbi:MAG TPA: bifunctional 4-hydroxy-2-oxoglutarate aldolase/2-dehydro-3-deoxy-phosphogluconate aldolase [Dissulfurispiraceae bacterium]|nr:bifunctional 4-hydroxy-2-oxoglutarate aldolase/2-dehydro-3-deoxy-phosphogluconate aldolase [Dissulfurispiraceae bacterium]